MSDGPEFRGGIYRVASNPREYVHLAREREVVASLSGQQPEPAPSGERFTLAGLDRALEAVKVAPYEPDPTHAIMTEQLNRLAATFDPGGRYECPVTGCGWALDVPPPELVEIPGEPRLGPDRYTWRVQYVGAPREQVELTIVLHLDSHATDGAPPVEDPPEPDPWLEDDDDEPEGWRIP